MRSTQRGRPEWRRGDHPGRRAEVSRTTSGRLIALEGIDGSGKTTQARLLAERTGAHLTFEPGATPLGASLRRLLLDPDLAIGTRAEALLMSADRAQHVAGVIAPLLADGRWVVTDRFAGSTLAYQGFGRGMEIAELERLVIWSTGGLRADLSILVDVPVEVAAARRAGGEPDRLERLGTAFHERVAEGFRRMAGQDPQRWAVVDGTAPVTVVSEAVRCVVEDRLGTPVGGGSRTP